MKNTLNRLFNHETLTREEAKTMLLNISNEDYNPAQVASFITVYRMREIALQELQGFRDALLELCVKINLDNPDTLDIVGTGGDGKNTFNISTISAVVVAGAGYKVTKHGGSGASSAVGSSNVLMQLGYQFTTDESTLKRQLDEVGLCFLHAPLFHPAMKAVAPIRKQLGMKTFFNMLGPLINPLQPKYQLFGTFSLELSRLYQYVMQETGRRFTIVYAMDGYDEISLTGNAKVRTNTTEKVLAPSDFNKEKLDPKSLHGGKTPEDAAKIFTNVLSNTATAAQIAVVTANAGLAIHCIKPEIALVDCVAEAKESIVSGQALATFKKLLN